MSNIPLNMATPEEEVLYGSKLQMICLLSAFILLTLFTINCHLHFHQNNPLSDNTETSISESEEKVIFLPSCYKCDTVITLEGDVYIVSWFHPGRKITLSSGILRLKTPLCIDGEGNDFCESYNNLPEIHVSLSSKCSEIAHSEKGNHTFKGEIFGAHTIYHVREIVMLVSEVDGISCEE